MKYIKTFEDIQTEPQIGDYVLLNPDDIIRVHIEFNNFINNNFGKIERFHFSGQRVFVIYDNDPPENIKLAFLYNDVLKKYYVSCRKKDIVAFAKTPEELKIKILTNKYNL